MKLLKVFYFAALLVVSSLCVSSCSDDDKGDDISPIEKSYFTIENAEYSKDQMPEPTTGAPIDGISLSNTAITGGVSVISVITTKSYKNFYFAVKGVEGHYKVSATSVSTNDNLKSDPDGGYNTYVIPLIFSMEYSTNFGIEVVAETGDGGFTDVYEETINYVETKTGNLHISLSFTSLKDVDLHLLTPSGLRIYYGNSHVTADLPGGGIASAHLDLDSNASCDIDGVNKENVYLDSYFIEPGTYSVYVDMYANCDPSVVTHYSVIAMDDNGIITNTLGNNPVSGVFPANQSSHNMLKVMEFVIDNTRASSLRIDLDNVKSAELSESAKRKLISSGLNY